jgi:hypothetical protein
LQQWTPEKRERAKKKKKGDHYFKISEKQEEMQVIRAKVKGKIRVSARGRVEVRVRARFRAV